MSIISKVTTTIPKPQPNTATNEAALKTRVLGDPFQADVVCHLTMDGSDEGTTFTDTSGNGHTFSATGGGVTDTDIVKFGTASAKIIDGVNSGIGSSTVTITDENTDFTLDAWVYLADDAYFGASRSSGIHVIFAEERNAGNANQWFSVNNNGSLTFFQGSAITSGNQGLTSAAGLIPYEEWHHIACSYDNAAQRMYLFADGVRVASRSWTTGGWYSQSRDFICGESYLPSYTVWASNLNGYVDDWRVTEACRYRHSFTPPAMQYLDNVGTSEWVVGASLPSSARDLSFDSVVFLSEFEGTDGATTAIDASNSNHTMTFEEGTEIDTAQSRFGSSSVLFDGIADWITTPGSTDFVLADSDFTLEFDVRFATDPGTGTMTFMGQYDTIEPDRCWVVDVINNDLRFGYSVNGTDFLQFTQSWNPAADTWYTVALTRNGADLRMYVDGTQLGSTQDISTDNINAPSPTRGLTLGGVEAGNPPPNTGTLLDGWMDNVRVTVGVARYTGSSYTVATEAFPTE